MNSDEVKQERSVPVQSRVDLVLLAKIAKYWETTECSIKSMSQLISWSVELLMDVLVSNNAINDEELSLTEARNYLSNRKLMQRSMEKKGIRKIATAMAFESMREDGVNPEGYVKRQHTVLHNENSVKPYNRGMARSEVCLEDVEMVQKMIAQARENKVTVEPEEERSSTVKEGMSKEEFEERSRKNEKEVRKRENVPVDVEEMMRLQEERLKGKKVKDEVLAIGG